eukprot:g30856.t1
MVCIPHMSLAVLSCNPRDENDAQCRTGSFFPRHQAQLLQNHAETPSYAKGAVQYNTLDAAEGGYRLVTLTRGQPVWPASLITCCMGHQVHPPRSRPGKPWHFVSDWSSGRRADSADGESSVAASSSATASQAMERMPYAVRAEAASSPGEVLPRASQQRHARAPRGRSGSSLGEVTMSGRSSPGELRSNGEVTDRGDVSGSEEGELPFPLSRAVPSSTGEVSRGEQAADSLSARSSGEVSSFAA